MKTYLVEFEFICGEYGQIFLHIIEAFCEIDVEAKIRNYLEFYYEDADSECLDDIWYYFSGEIAVKCHGYREIARASDVVDRLKVS
jgi:hypothetical protein